jgi:hypothetical protein
MLAAFFKIETQKLKGEVNYEENEVAVSSLYDAPRAAAGGL